MTVLRYPVVPAVLGVVLGPLLEKSYFKALLLSDGSYKIFFATPLAVILWLILGAVLMAPYIMRGKKRTET